MQKSRLEFLAWPIIAHCGVDALVQDQPTKIRRQVKFLDAYAQEPRFVSKLLAALTNYHLLPEEAKSLKRKIAEVSNQCCAEDFDAWFNTGEGGRGAGLDLYDWKSIAEIIGCKNSPAQLRTEFYREKRRRQSIRTKWNENFEAWEELEARRKGKSLLPLQTVSVRD